MKHGYLLCLCIFLSMPFQGIGQSGILDFTFDPGTSTDGVSMVFAVAELNDGRIVAGGNFTSYQEVPRNGLVALLPDGSIDLSFADAMPPGTNIYDLTVDSQGRLLVAGYFFAVGDAPMNGIVRLMPTGEVDPTFDAGGGTNYSVHKVLLQDDGKIVIGGQFVSVDGLPYHGVARLQPDGAVDTSFDIGAGFFDLSDPVYPYVRTIALDYDGNILVGGEFDLFNNTPVGPIVRLAPTGSLDTSFQSNVLAG
jgi:uncharacterized delta-60 repeat protein